MRCVSVGQQRRRESQEARDHPLLPQVSTAPPPGTSSGWNTTGRRTDPAPEHPHPPSLLVSAGMNPEGLEPPLVFSSEKTSARRDHGFQGSLSERLHSSRASSNLLTTPHCSSTERVALARPDCPPGAQRSVPTSCSRCEPLRPQRFPPRSLLFFPEISFILSKNLRVCLFPKTKARTGKQTVPSHLTGQLRKEPRTALPHIDRHC